MNCYQQKHSINPNLIYDLLSTKAFNNISEMVFVCTFIIWQVVLNTMIYNFLFECLLILLQIHWIWNLGKETQFKFKQRSNANGGLPVPLTNICMVHHSSGFETALTLENCKYCGTGTIKLVEKRHFV